MSCAKTAELIEMLFGMWTRVGGPNAPSVSWEPRSLEEKGQFVGGGGRLPAVQPFVKILWPLLSHCHCCRYGRDLLFVALSVRGREMMSADAQ